MTATATTLATGRIVAIAGPVVDVEFPPNAVPEINTALEFTLTLDGTEVIVVAEVAQPTEPIIDIEKAWFAAHRSSPR